MGSGEVAIVALSTMISLKVTFSDGLGGGWGGVALVGFLIRVKNAPPLKKNLKDLSWIKKN